LRGLEKAQRVKFILSQEVESIIKQKLKKAESASILEFDDILRFTLINQIEQQGKDNFKALRQELASITQLLLLEVLLKKEYSTEEKQKAVVCLMHEWIKDAAIPPKDLYGSIRVEAESAGVVEDEKKKLLDSVEEIFAVLPFLKEHGVKKEEIDTAILQICKDYLQTLPAKVRVPLRDMDSDQTAEIEQQTQTEQETQLEVQEHQEKERVQLGEINARSLEKEEVLNDELLDYHWQLPYVALETYCHKDPLLELFSRAFDGISLTLNVLEWPKEKPKTRDLTLLGNHRTPFHFLRVQNDGSVIILNQQDAANLKGPSLYNLTFGFYDPEKPVSKQLLERVAKIKFLNGDTSYSKEELACLKPWIQAHGVENMLELFQKHILSGYPEKAAAYTAGNLRLLFKDISQIRPLA
jgi:hypothetical protein